MFFEMLIALALLAVAAALAAKLFKVYYPKFVVYESHIGLLYKNGKFIRQLQPGAHRCWGTGCHVQSADMRKIQISVAGQELLTSDSISVRVTLLVSYRIVDPLIAEHEWASYRTELHSCVQLAVRDAMQKRTMEELLVSRNEINSEMKTAIAASIGELGLELLKVEVRDITLPGDLKRAFAEVLKVRKEGLAALERSRAEQAALRSLANAARVLENNAELYNLRVLQVVENGNGGAGNTIVLGVPGGLIPMGKRNSGRLKSDAPEQ